MSDLTFCHLHMTNRDMLIFETFENPSTYLSGELSDEELEIPAHEVPPNPDDSDVLPSQVHPSYPYGNPTNLKHPAARPRKPTDLSSRALFADLSYAGGGVNGALRWRDLALDSLLPVDKEHEESPPQPAQPGQQLEESEEDDDVEGSSEDVDSGSMDDEDDDENENSENFEVSFEE
ncbi:hypothetical protein DFH11DRAFT_1880142 [Phellopilus nigrolimitatus]|nr:hypothetical protein DFH11DRAFT_1880142 [Phellopilus nigrolimitatus]